MNLRQSAFAAFAALAITGFATSASAAPMTYSFDDSNAVNFGNSVGAGKFTFDLPDDAIGTFNATGVMGGPGSFLDEWDRVLLFVASDRISLSIREDGVGGVSSSTRGVLSLQYGLGGFTSAAQAWGLVVADPRGTFAGVTISEKTAAIPEPTSLSLLGFGLLGLVAAARRRRAPKWYDPHKHRRAAAGF